MYNWAWQSHIVRGDQGKAAGFYSSADGFAVWADPPFELGRPLKLRLAETSHLSFTYPCSLLLALAWASDRGLACVGLPAVPL